MKIRIFKISLKDIGKIISFLKKNWNKNHIFVKNIKFFKWQYQNKKKLSFICAVIKKKIIGVISYIPQDKYDKNIKNLEIFLTISKVIEKTYPGIWQKILTKILKIYKPKFIGTTGFNHDLINFHKLNNFTTGQFNHYAAVNHNIKNFKIIKFKGNKKKIFLSKYIFLKINQKFLINNNVSKLFKNQIPTKTKIFLINRYIKHPIYKYHLYCIFNKNKKPIAIVVLRQVFYKNSNAFRIIDFIGDDKSTIHLGNIIQNIFSLYNSEFVDFYFHGINCKYLKKLNMLDVNKNKLIIPDNYSPLERKKTILMYGYINKYKNKSKIKIFKGDGDRDRPSYINGLYK